MGWGDWVDELVGGRGRTETLLHVPPLGGAHLLARRWRRLAWRWAAAAATAAEGVAATASHATASHATASHATAHAARRRSCRRPRWVVVRPGHLLGTVLVLGVIERLAVADAGAILERVAILEGIGMYKHIIAALVRNDETCATVTAGAWSDGQVAGREWRGAIGWMSWWVGVDAPKPFSMFHRLAVPINLPGGGSGSPGGGPPPPPPPPKPPPPPPLKSDASPAPPLLKPVGAAPAAAPAPDMNFCESCCASAIAAARASRGTAAENPAAAAGGPSEKPEPAAGTSEKRLRRLGGSSTALSRSRDRERSRSRLLRSSSRRSDMAEPCARCWRVLQPKLAQAGPGVVVDNDADDEEVGSQPKRKRGTC